jgi:hypothetical protein
MSNAKVVTAAACHLAAAPRYFYTNPCRTHRRVRCGGPILSHPRLCRAHGQFPVTVSGSIRRAAVDLIRFVRALQAQPCHIHTMTDQWMFLSAVFGMSIVVAAVSGYFVFQGEDLTAIFFGLPPVIAIGGSLWMTRDFFAEKPR